MRKLSDSDEAGMLISTLLYDLADKALAYRINNILNQTGIESDGSLLIEMFSSIEQGTLRQFYASSGFELSTSALDLLDYYESMQLISKNVDQMTVIAKLRELNNPLISEIVIAFVIEGKSVARDKFHMSIFREAYDINYGTTRLSEVLNAALQFKDLLYEGRFIKDYKVDLASFIYTRAFLFIYEHTQDDCQGNDDNNALLYLSSLCDTVTEVNQFEDNRITAKLLALLETCMNGFPSETCRLLSSHAGFYDSIKTHCGWTPLGRTDVGSQFDLRFEFASQMGMKESECSILYIGRVCFNALRRVNNPRTKLLGFQAPVSNVDSRQPLEFPITMQIKLPGKLWSVSCDKSGKYALFGDDEGQLYLLTFSNLAITQLGTGIHSTKNYLPGKEQIRAHPTKIGIFAVCGGGILSVVDANNPNYITTEYDMKGNSYGNVCWHPLDTDLLLYCNTAQEKIYMVRASKREILRTFKIEKPISAITYCGGTQIGLLTAKVAGNNHQVVILLDFNTAAKVSFEIPTQTSTSQYTTLVCSTWDNRTLMLLGSPNIILLVDKIGKRPTRIIYGPTQRNYMLRAAFFGPMDKYILAVSEEPDDIPKAFIYNRFTGQKVGYLIGHSDQINDISLLNSPEPLLITVGDDMMAHFHKFESENMRSRSALKSC